MKKSVCVLMVAFSTGVFASDSNIIDDSESLNPDNDSFKLNQVIECASQLVRAEVVSEEQNNSLNRGVELIRESGGISTFKSSVLPNSSSVSNQLSSHGINPSFEMINAVSMETIYGQILESDQSDELMNIVRENQGNINQELDNLNSTLNPYVDFNDYQGRFIHKSLDSDELTPGVLSIEGISSQDELQLSYTSKLRPYFSVETSTNITENSSSSESTILTGHPSNILNLEIDSSDSNKKYRLANRDSGEILIESNNHFEVCSAIQSSNEAALIPTFNGGREVQKQVDESESASPQRQSAEVDQL
ncbi:MAG: hypothetical protein CME65_01020 [Halobacteriovoraceae bacterium]|nr:hypothetical protein [Halobacteriovoraceae bacterium]|tara:strand:+ start:2918 stop:3835 length:918 start_codon:yes stop_codon:yes gene_type:complete